MIITVTLNPAVDRTITLNELIPGHVNRVLENRQDAGGKGINVSKSIKALGHESLAFAVLGGRNGNFISHHIMSMDIKLEVFNIPGETRQNMKIVDQKNHQYTDINEAGPVIEAGTADEIKTAIVRLLKEGTVLVLSGSAAPGFDSTIYAELIREANRQGCRVILDADDLLLKEALAEAPWLVKPNIHELEALAGHPLDTMPKLKAAARTILNQGVKAVVVSMGKDGAVWIDEKRAFLVKSLSVPVRSTVGAGDAMVAALAVALDQGIDPETAMRLATVSSAASVMAEGSSSGDPQDLKAKMSIVEIVPLTEE